MKITSNFNTKNVTFGYDKQLNRELKEQLSTHPNKAWANTLLNMANFTNDVEDKLELESKTSEVDGLDNKYWDFLDMFLSLKEALTGFVSVEFEDLNYADREIAYYQDEFLKTSSNPDDWKNQACNVMKSFASPEVIKKLEAGEPIDINKKTSKPVHDEEPIIEQVQSVDSVQNKASVGLSSKSILEEYTPTSISPKGFSDVAGMDNLKRDLQEGIIQLIENPQQAQMDFEDYGKTIPKAVLLYGPPGCGKTYITQALSQEIGMPLYLLNISKAGSEYINMTSKNIKDAFDEAISIAKTTDKPCLLFMDEIDSLAFDRTSGMQTDDLKQVGTILQSMDLAKSQNVIILGATNKYDILDPAVKRRFDSKVLVDVPDEKARLELLKKNLTPLRKGQTLLENKEDLEAIARLLNGYSNSSICNISKQAALNALRRDRSDISIVDYKEAIKITSEEKPNRRDYLPDSVRSSKHIGFNA